MVLVSRFPFVMVSGRDQAEEARSNDTAAVRQEIQLGHGCGEVTSSVFCPDGALEKDYGLWAQNPTGLVQSPLF